MSIDLLLFIALILFLILFIYKKRKKVSIQKIVYPFIYLVVYRTKLGLKLMDKFAKRKKILSFFSYFNIIISFLGMIFIVYLLVISTVKLFIKKAAAPSVMLVLPVKARGIFYVPFFYWILAIIVIATIHEFSHGVFARFYNLKIKSSGFAFFSLLLPVIPAAFVEPSEEALKKKSKKKQISIFAAGPSSNIIAAFIFLAIALLIFIPITNKIMNYDGVIVDDFTSNSSARKAGISKGEIIVAIDNTTIKTIDDLAKVLANKKSHETIELKTENNSYNVLLGENPENKSKPYLGVYLRQHQSFIYNKGIGLILSKIFIWLSGLIYWLFLLNLGVGLFNLLPISFLDGGRILLAFLEIFLSKEKAQILWANISLIFILIILINIIFPFV